MVLKVWGAAQAMAKVKEEVSAEVFFSDGALRFHYQIRGRGADWPDLKEERLRERRDEIWKNDCMEVFWSENGTSYWEMNLAPNGDWQIYFFEDYRKKGCPEMSLRLTDLKSRKEKDVFHMEGKIGGPRGSFLQVQLFQPTVILREKEGFLFWAPKHEEQRPDFHKMSLWVSVERNEA
jgi:hypothetical protein